MLRSVAKGTIAPATAIKPEEDRLLRAAFGRYGGGGDARGPNARIADARAAAAAVVARYQQLGAGCWFLCDCLAGAQHPPALVPVSQTHIRRHEDGRWPAHWEGCDFSREPEEQRAITASYASPSASRPLRLTRPLGRGTEPMQRSVDRSSHHAARPGIARLLIQVVTEAGLQAIEAGWRPASLVDQVKAIWSAAKRIEIDAGVHLPEFLCTSPARLGELVAKVGSARPERFRRTRPHGVLIVRVAAIGNGVLRPVSGEPIPVRGRLAVFGERADAGRESSTQRAARAPYLAACVVGRVEEGGPVEVLSAYAHPCVASGHLMLVDSNMERRTLSLLRSVQAWLSGNRRDVAMSIEKPMYDVGGEDRPGASPRPPLIPDFVVRARSAEAGAAGSSAGAGAGADAVGRTVIVETMGFADETYRDRKERIHPAMSAALGGVRVIRHEFHEPTDLPQKLRDERFWREVRLALAGPEQRAGPAGNAVAVAVRDRDVDASTVAEVLRRQAAGRRGAMPERSATR